MSVDLLQSVYVHDPNIVSRDIAEEVILVPIRKNVADMDCIFTLNETAARAWELFDGVRSVEDIHKIIIEEFSVGSEEAKADLMELVQALLKIAALLVVGPRL